MFLFLILRMYTKFQKNRSINRKGDSETMWSPLDTLCNKGLNKFKKNHFI